MIGLKITEVKKAKTYNSEDSLVVTHPTTNSTACGFNAATSRVLVLHFIALVIISVIRIVLFAGRPGSDMADNALPSK
ncbi:hypothetical protein N7461_007572, partial [Penicillium sp. DV-2018c]